MTHATPHAVARRRVMILGGTSAIAEATARLYAAAGAHLLLVGRSDARLQSVAQDLAIRGAADVRCALADFAETADAQNVFASWVSLMGDVDHIILAYGVLGDQEQMLDDVQEAERLLHIDFTSAAVWCLCAAAYLEKRGRGSLVVIGSVAGDRGRRKNFVYGAAKAGLATLVEGLAHRFAEKGPRAVIVKPSPTISPMTAGLARTGPTWSKPDDVARVVYHAAEVGGPVVYAPSYWRLVMLMIRLLPTRLFNKLDI